jgi:hypothetical protein
MQEVADAVACFSKAWKIGVSVTEIFAVNPDQVSKQAESGEYMSKGAFMIRGKRNFYQGKMVVAVGKLEDGRVMSASESAVKTHCKEYAFVLQGRDKPSDCAKKIARKIKADIDEVLRVLPAGTCQVK